MDLDGGVACDVASGICAQLFDFSLEQVFLSRGGLGGCGLQFLQLVAMGDDMILEHRRLDIDPDDELPALGDASEGVL